MKLIGTTELSQLSLRNLRRLEIETIKSYLFSFLLETESQNSALLVSLRGISEEIQRRKLSPSHTVGSWPSTSDQKHGAL